MSKVNHSVTIVNLYSYKTYQFSFQTKHKTPMVRTQSIISVSDEIIPNSRAGSNSNLMQENNISNSREGSSSRKNRLRGRRIMTKTLKNISGSSQEDTGGKDMLEHIGLSKVEDRNGVKSCSPRRSNTANSMRYKNLLCASRSH